MRVALTAISFLLIASNTNAGGNRQAKEKLAALKKRLPGVVDAWTRAHPLGKEYVPVLRRVRAVGKHEAKVAVHVHYVFEGERNPTPSFILTVRLKYHEGLWNALRFEWSRYPDVPPTYRDTFKEAAHFLLDAIDEAAEK